MAAKKKGTKRGARRPWKLEDVPMEVPAQSTWRVDWRDRATTLWAAYNRTMLEAPEKQAASAAGKWVGKGWAEETIKVFYALDVWCRDRKIDPIIWVTWSVRRVTKAGAPGVSLKALFSEKSIDVFREDPMADVDRSLHVDTKITAQLQPVRHRASPFWGHDLARHNFVIRGQAVLCRELPDITGGFDSRSAVCASCPEKAPCAAQKRSS